MQVSPLLESRWPWPKMNVKEVANRAFDNDIYMPNIGFINIGQLKAWSAELGRAENSKKLWINSLVTSHACLRYAKETCDDKYLFRGLKLIRSYLQQYDYSEGIFDSAWKDEHAVANRLFVLTAFLHYFYEKNGSLVEQEDLFFHAGRHACWLADEDNYVKNNHGVMMDMALTQYSVLIRDIDEQASELFIEVATKRLDEMLRISFDSDGCCTENSPSYHFVNYSLFSSIYAFFVKYELKGSLQGWRSILDKAKTVGALFLRSDGTIPLIGDSEMRPGSFFQHTDALQASGIGYYPEAGFFVYANPSVHMTLRAGGQSFAHRHIDDLSLTLWVRGKEFISDGGLYNYDVGDNRRRWLISSRAHSGFYLESQGRVLFRNFDHPKAMSRFINAGKEADGYLVKASHNLSGNAVVERRLFVSDTFISVNDAFESTSFEKWRYQLLLHPDVEVSRLSESSIFLRNEGVEVIFEFAAVGRDKSVMVTVEDSFMSPKFLAVADCKMLVLSGCAKSQTLCTKFCLI